MALHAGMAEPHDGDYLAASLNRLARLLDAAHGEQILLSSTVAGLAREALPEAATLKALGELSAARHRATRGDLSALSPRAAADFPPLNTPGHLPHNLPTHPTPFLGREREMEDVVALLLRPDVRLVTLTGPGGVGKTRLGARVAAESLESFPDGAFLVDLARLTDPASGALGDRDGPRAARAAGAAAGSRRSAELSAGAAPAAPVRQLRARPAGGAARGRSAGRRPGVKVLVTSRARLGLQAEHEYRVEPLPIPDQETIAARGGAVHLRCDRALRRARASAAPGLHPDRGERHRGGGDLCRLDGLPLAIELAAARIKLLSARGAA